MQPEAAGRPLFLPAPLVSRLQKLVPALALAASRGSAVAAQMVAQIVVGTLAGPAGLGVLQLFTSWTCMAGEVLAQGLPAQAMRTAAVDYSRGDMPAIRNYLQRATIRIVRFWLPLAALSTGLLILLNSLLQTDESATYAIIVAAVLVAAPLFSLLRLGAEALKAMDAPLAAVTLENLGPPAVLLAICLACWLLGIPVLAPVLLMAGIAGLAITPLWLWKALRRRLLSSTPKVASTPQENAPQYGDAHYLWASSVLNIAYLHLPFLLLPWFANTSEIGIYAIAHKLINVVTTLLILLAAVFGPAFARAAAGADKTEMAQLLRRTQLISTAIYLPITIGLLLASAPLASLFNLEPGTLRPYLLILAGGHLINSVTGLSGVMLNMAGAAKVELLTLASAAAVAVTASLIVGPAHGALGLACIFSATVAIKNLASYAAARHYLKQWEIQ